MRCTCGHLVHSGEMESKIYYDICGKITVRWACASCKTRKLKTYTIGQLKKMGINARWPIETIYQHIKTVLFVSDMQSSFEILEFKMMGNITTAEVKDIKKISCETALKLFMGVKNES